MRLVHYAPAMAWDYIFFNDVVSYKNIAYICAPKWMKSMRTLPKWLHKFSDGSEAPVGYHF